MPTIPIHLEVAKKLEKNLNITNNEDFYLGVIAPDAVNLNGFAQKEIRWKSHIRNTDLSIWRSNIRSFYLKNKNNYPKDFLLGYITHILTDIIFDDLFYIPIRNKMLNNSIPLNKTHELILEEMDSYASKSVIYNKVKINMKDIRNYYNIKNIDKKMLEEWHKKQINLTLREKTSTYITEDIINNLTENVNNELKKLISN